MSRQKREGVNRGGNGCMIKALREQHKYLLNKLNWPWVICMCRTNGNSLGPVKHRSTNGRRRRRAEREREQQRRYGEQQTADVRPGKRTLDNEPMTRKPKLKEWPGAACATQPCLHLGYWHCLQTALLHLPLWLSSLSFNPLATTSLVF